MKISFYGAAKRVTGSNFLVEHQNTKFLVDCGLFQGDKEANLENWNNFIFDPRDIDFVIVTHSHIDHIGRLPLLYKNGFRGKVYSTKPTKEFADIFLEDEYGILADFAKENNIEKLFDTSDILGISNQFESYDYYQEIAAKNNVKIKFYDAGHILGSAIVEVIVDNKTIIFSGDLGNPPVPILRDTDFIKKADYLILESTYGDRNHEPYKDRLLKLERIVEETCNNNGTLLIPAFAMERTQEIIYELNQLIKEGKVKNIPIFIDSPLAIKVTQSYRNFPTYFDKDALEWIKNNEDFFDFPELKFIKSSEESKKLDNLPGKKIIIAGSGMSTAGRILFHEKRYLSDPSTILLIVGYQAKGTLGRLLKEQTKQVIISGQNVTVRAKIEIIEAYSAHADLERLKYWVSKIEKPIEKIFLVHGEPEAQDNLMHRLQEEQGIDIYIPEFGETVEL